jgi:polyisoprenoid-binding protein YceI
LHLYIRIKIKRSDYPDCSLLFACAAGHRLYMHGCSTVEDTGRKIPGKIQRQRVNGTTQGLKGTVNFDPMDPGKSNDDVTVDVNTLNTGNNLKNKHARAKDYFDVETYPTIRFTSDSIGKTGTGYTSTGMLTIKDVTKEIMRPFSFFIRSGWNRRRIQRKF